VRSEGFYVNKNPLTPAGIEPASFRFIAQHLNHCATTVHGVKSHNDSPQCAGPRALSASLKANRQFCPIRKRDRRMCL